MHTPIGGNKWSHQQTRNANARMAKARRARAIKALQYKKCECGRFVGDPVCQCRINQVRKDTLADKNVQLCLDMAAKREEEETTTQGETLPY